MGAMQRDTRSFDHGSCRGKRKEHGNYIYGLGILLQVSA